MMLFAYIALTLIIFRFLVAVINLISRLHLSEDQKSPDASLVSLLIPARNEGENIIRLLNDIEEQPFKNIEVIIYDDDSEDQTAALVQEFIADKNKYRLISGTQLPEDWLGKNYACHELAKAAQGDYLLFLDADVRIRGNLISSAIEHLKKYGLQLVSIFPKQIMESLGEKLTVPLMNLILLSLLPMTFIRRMRNPAFAAANGQFMLFTAKNYNMNKWHEKFRKEKVEDIAIQRAIKKQNGKVDTLLGDQHIECRMYHGFFEGVKGFAKNLPSFYGNSFLMSGLYMCITYIGFLLVVLKLSWFHGMAYCMAGLLIHGMIACKSRQSVAESILYLLPRTLVIPLVYFSSLYLHATKKMIWKGRRVL